MIGEDESRNRRKCYRVLCSDLITVRWGSGRGFARSETAVLEDYSAAGASLFIPVRIEPGTAITLRSVEESFRAMVRRCEWRDNGYLLGIEFDEPRPEGDSFTPEHRLDPEELGI
jgi:PilZ domain-containing protein